MALGATSKGSTDQTEKFLKRVQTRDIFSDLDRYGQAGVTALAQATPKDTGETSISWHYRIIRTSRSVTIEWYNTHVDANGTSVAILIQYGHGTNGGGYVQGRDFINPVMRPLFDQIANDIWKKVSAP